MRDHHFSSACSYLPDTFTLQAASFTICREFSDFRTSKQNLNYQANEIRRILTRFLFPNTGFLTVVLKTNEIYQGADFQSNKRKPAFCNKCFNPILPLIVLLKASVTYEPPCFINCNCNVNTCIRIFCNQNLVISRQAIMVVWCKLIGSVSGIAHAEEIPGNGASFRGKIFLFWVRILLLCISWSPYYFFVFPTLLGWESAGSNKSSCLALSSIT